MSRKPGEGGGTYVHPQTIPEDHALRLARRAIRDQQSFALVFDKPRFQAWCPAEDEDRFVALIEDTREL